MRKVLVLLLAVCGFTAAMVPREKRALNTEDKISSPPSSSAKPANSTEICQPHTPCAWSTYKPVIKIIDNYVTNNYCICGVGTNCVITEDDKAVSAYVHRCRTPDDTDTDIETR